MAIRSHIRSLVLPLAMLLAVLFNNVCGLFYGIVPYLVFTMLFLNYTAIDVRRMHPSWLHLWLLLFQAGISFAFFLLLRLTALPPALSEGMMICVLTPVAASVVVVACALGANRECVTTYTILANLMVAILAPIYFSFIGVHQDLPFVASFWKIFCRVVPQIVFPFILALLLQHFLPRINIFFCQYKSISLYVWALTLTIILGKTFHDVVEMPDRDGTMLWLMALLSALICAFQFAAGKWMGSLFNKRIEGGQLLGQKNTSFGIWLAIEYLNPTSAPISAVAMALYSMWQNLFNSWQMWQHDKRATNTANND